MMMKKKMRIKMSIKTSHNNLPSTKTYTKIKTESVEKPSNQAPRQSAGIKQS